MLETSCGVLHWYKWQQSIASQHPAGIEELLQHTCTLSAMVMVSNDFEGHANSFCNSTALYLDGEAGVELQLECQESGQGTPRANMRGVKYVKSQRRR